MSVGVGNKTRVVILDDYQGVSATMVNWAGSRHNLEVFAIRDHLDEAALAAQLSGANVIIAMRERTELRREFLERFSSLELVVTTGMANAAIEVPAGVSFCGTRILPYPVAELTWALILGASRKLESEQANLRAGLWQREIGSGLFGKNLGLLGLGKAGTQVARVANAFGMRVSAYSQNLDPEYARSQNVTPVGIEELFAQSDVVSVHLRLSERTNQLVGSRLLNLMPSHALLVNTSRAQIIVQEDLVTALESRRIGGAALDVFYKEPIDQNEPLLRTPNTTLTPHIGYVVQENYELFFADALENIEAFLDGSPVRVIV